MATLMRSLSCSLLLSLSLSITPSQTKDSFVIYGYINTLSPALSLPLSLTPSQTKDTFVINGYINTLPLSFTHSAQLYYVNSQCWKSQKPFKSFPIWILISSIKFDRFQLTITWHNLEIVHRNRNVHTLICYYASVDNRLFTT